MSEAVGLALRDTDILSAVMRQDPRAVAHARTYLAVHHRFTFSLITRYEILRGLHAKQATAQLAAFDRLCATSTIVPLTDAIVSRAATIYADLHQRGLLIGDADILIAATSLDQRLMLVTNNEHHYRRIPSIDLVNWLV